MMYLKQAPDSIVNVKELREKRAASFTVVAFIVKQPQEMQSICQRHQCRLLWFGKENPSTQRVLDVLGPFCGCSFKEDREECWRKQTLRGRCRVVWKTSTAGGQISLCSSKGKGLTQNMVPCVVVSGGARA